MNYVTNMFLLVRSSVSSKQLLCFVHGQGQKREQRQLLEKFDRFHNQFPSINYGSALLVNFEVKIVTRLKK